MKSKPLTVKQLKDLRWKLRREIEEAQEYMAVVELALAQPIETSKH